MTGPHPPHYPHSERFHSSRWRLSLAFATQAVFFLVELVGGILTNSLALLADAGHMLSDVGALGLSLLALHFTTKAPTPQKTYGYHRLEILAALINGLVLWAMAAYLFYEGYRRLLEPPAINSLPLLLIAALGLLVNLLGVAILYPVRGYGINLRSALLHLAADSLGSVAAIAAGGAIWLKGWYWFDPLAGSIIAVLIVLGSWQLVFEATDILMESTPKHIDLGEVERALASHPGVKHVHDLHIWTIASGLHALSVHVVVNGRQERDCLIGELEDLLKQRFGLEHTTMQAEGPGYHNPWVCPLHPQARSLRQAARRHDE